MIIALKDWADQKITQLNKLRIICLKCRYLAENHGLWDKLGVESFDNPLWLSMPDWEKAPEPLPKTREDGSKFFRVIEAGHPETIAESPDTFLKLAAHCRDLIMQLNLISVIALSQNPNIGYALKIDLFTEELMGVISCLQGYWIRRLEECSGKRKNAIGSAKKRENRINKIIHDIFPKHPFSFEQAFDSTGKIRKHYQFDRKLINAVKGEFEKKRGSKTVKLGSRTTREYLKEAAEKMFDKSDAFVKKN